MALNIKKLENVKFQQGKIIAQCPACAEMGQDNKGEHLFINDEDKFGCVVYPDESGVEHRKRIFALVGTKETSKCINVRKKNVEQCEIVIPDILGRLGRRRDISEEREETNKNITPSTPLNTVPEVPDVTKNKGNRKQ